MPQLTFKKIKQNTHHLGWRYNDTFPPEAIKTIQDFAHDEDFRTLFFSPKRTVTLDAFSIAKTTVTWEDLVEWETDAFYEAETLEAFCDLLDQRLRTFGWRLPTEDEFEAACGGSLFVWGDEIPDGEPSGSGTEFTKHKMPTESGLLLNADTYNIELVRHQIKLGDGGEAICGGYPYPIAWLALSPKHRIPKEMYGEAFIEYLEDAGIRPVLL